jgi:hypothetical protein
MMEDVFVIASFGVEASQSVRNPCSSNGVGKAGITGVCLNTIISPFASFGFSLDLVYSGDFI